MAAGSLTIDTLEPRDGWTVLALRGTIDEHADLTPVARGRHERLVLDLAGVRRINSIGVSKWIRAMRAIAGDVPVRWERVSPAMAVQLTMIANFAGHARVRSLLAPYYCPACDEEREVLLNAATLPEGTSKAPARRCPACEGPLVFDDVEEGWLSAIAEVADRASQEP